MDHAALSEFTTSDVVHIHNTFPQDAVGLYARRGPVPVVVTLHNFRLARER